MKAFVKLKPAFKDYIWGGTRLKTKYSKETDLDIAAESWELSAHKDGESVIASGEHEGMIFSKFLTLLSSEELGTKVDKSLKFPLLVKFIDAKDNLSVQVHPDDSYALKYENEYGKNEMWYVADCDDDAFLYVGFNRDVTREEIKERLSDNTILEVLNKVYTHPGDCFYIPAGTVHAIGKGNLICEIQQSSNSTYRLYDYNRRDVNGNLRELHLDKSLDVLNYKKYINSDAASVKGSHVLVSSDYFKASLYESDDYIIIPANTESFMSLICIEGEGYISSSDCKEQIKAGDSFFVLANREVEITGKIKLIVSNL